MVESNDKGAAEKERKFKVVDRRRFNEDGEEKTGPNVTETRATSGSESSVRAQVKEARENPSTEKSDMAPPAQDRDPITFSLFIQSLAHQALMSMGLVPWPDSKLIKKNLELARETIDILSMLREKTKGNLEQQEDKMFESLLYELRMNFVNVVKGGGAPKK